MMDGKIKFPIDRNGTQVELGDKVKGFGFITFQDGFKIDLRTEVTANIQNGRLYFGNMSYESFTDGFLIISKNGR